MSKYIDQSTLRAALAQLKGTSGVPVFIWLTLKEMGLTRSNPVMIDTGNSEEALKRLFAFGHPDGDFFFPTRPTHRYRTYKAHAARSVVQTNIVQWLDNSGTIRPQGLFDVQRPAGHASVEVRTQRTYPLGLGVNRDGLAHGDGTRVCIPLIAWAVWYGRHTSIPDDESPAPYLVSAMLSSMHISKAEQECMFVDRPFEVHTATRPLTEEEIFQTCEDDPVEIQTAVVPDTLELNRERIAMTMSISTGPAWLDQDPASELAALLEEGHKAILLSGPPRTGKTRAVRGIVGDAALVIQIHDGWTYDHLVLGQTIVNSNVEWKSGPLLEAIRGGAQYIVLEEANRTRLPQALGDVFSLIEPAYRGEDHSITLRDGTDFFVPEDTVLFFTMNTIDKSTEEVDDALLGRVRAVDFPPRVEDLRGVLDAEQLPVDLRMGLSKFFQGVQKYYPLGHGYFVGLTPATNLVRHYLSAIRPVLANHFGAFDPQTLEKIDSLFDEVVVKGGR